MSNRPKPRPAGDTARRVAAVLILTGAAVVFASRFNAPVTVAPPTPTEPLERVALPPLEDVGTTSAPTVISTTSTSTTTTILLPDPVEDGDVFEGPRIYTQWGWVKVEIRVLEGVMVDVDMVMIPRNTKRSEALSLEYEPILREQALTRQTPDVDAITGATVISSGFKSSLTGAMRAAEIWSPPEN